MSEAGQLLADVLAAPTLTIVPSRKTAPDPMTVATSVQRWRVVIGPGDVRGSAGSECGARSAAAASVA